MSVVENVLSETMLIPIIKISLESESSTKFAISFVQPSMARECTVPARHSLEVRMPICRGTLVFTNRYPGQAVTDVASSPVDNLVFLDLTLRASLILAERPHVR